MMPSNNVSFKAVSSAVKKTFWFAFCPYLGWYDFIAPVFLLVTALCDIISGQAR